MEESKGKMRKLIIPIILALLLLGFVSATFQANSGYGDPFSDYRSTGNPHVEGVLSGTPIVYSSSTYGNSGIPVVSGDVDNDGNDEFVSIYTSGGTSTLNIFDGQMNLLDSVGLGYGANMPAIFDLDSDGKQEIIVPLEDGEVSAKIYNMDTGFLTLEDYEHRDFGGSYNNTSGISCINFGGYARCFVVTEISNTHFLLSTLKYVSGNNYEMETPLQINTTNGVTWHNTGTLPAVSDIDNDGALEVVFILDYDQIIKAECHGASEVDCDNSSTYTDIYPVENYSGIVADIPITIWDKDGVGIEYLALSRGYDKYSILDVINPSGSELFEKKVFTDGGSSYGFGNGKASVVDIDKDGKDEICAYFSSKAYYGLSDKYLGTIRCYDYLGNTVVSNSGDSYTDFFSGYYFSSAGGSLEENISFYAIKGKVYKLDASSSTLQAVYDSGYSSKISQLIDLNSDGQFDFIANNDGNLKFVDFAYQSAPPPTEGNTLNIYVEDYDTLSPVENYKLYDILNGTSYYTNASGKVTITGLPDNVKLFGQKSNYFYYVGLNITMSDTVTGASLFPYNTASVTLTEISDKNYTLNITVFETQTFLDTYLSNGTTAISNSPIYSIDYDVTFNTQALGDLSWALVDGTYNFLIVDYNITKLGVVKEGDTSVYWDISEGGGLPLSQQCIDDNNLCLNPVIQDGELVCPLGASYECPLGCDDYRCNDCNWFGCVYDDEIYNASIPKSHYGWYVDQNNWSYQYQYNDSIKSNYVSLGNVMFMQTSPVLGIELYNDIPDYISSDWFMESKWLLPYNGAVIVNALDESNNTIFAYQLNSVDLNFSYVYIDEWNGTGWHTIINGSGGGIDIDEPFEVYVENKDGNCTLKLDTNLDGSYDYETGIFCYSGNEIDLLEIIPSQSYTAGIFNDGFLAWDYFRVGKVSSETTCDSFEDDFNYGTSIQTGGGWYGDVLYPQVGTTDEMEDALSQWYPALEDSDYNTAGLTLKHSELNYIGHTTDCFQASQKFIMDYAILPYKAPPIQDKTWDYTYDIYFDSDNGEYLILRIEKSASSFWTPSGHKSAVSLWNGIGWVDSGIEISDFDYHRLALEIDFNFNLARVRLDDATTLIDYEPIYLSNPTIEDIEIHPSDTENADTLLWIDYIAYGVEGRAFNDRYTPTEAGIAEEDFNQQTGLQEQYSCGWNWTGGEGNYFDWSLCTPEEQAIHSTWCIIKVLGKCTIGNITVWILNNVLFFLVLIILIALFVPFVIHRKKS